MPIVTESTLERAAGVRQRFRATIYHAERARDDAIPASIANIRLDIHAAKFRAHDGACRTRFEAAGIRAMFANVRGKSPGENFRGIAAEARDRSIFDKLYVPPGGVPERAGVVVGQREEVEAIRGHLIPFLARHFARFAADA